MQHLEMYIGGAAHLDLQAVPGQLSICSLPPARQEGQRGRQPACSAQERGSRQAGRSFHGAVTHPGIGPGRVAYICHQRLQLLHRPVPPLALLLAYKLRSRMPQLPHSLKMFWALP